MPVTRLARRSYSEGMQGRRTRRVRDTTVTPLARGFLIGVVAGTLALASCAAPGEQEMVRMEQRIEALLELHTFEHIYRDLVYFGEERSFLFIKTVDRAVLFSVDLRVRAGIDLSDGVTLTPDRSDPSRIYVRLPPAEVLSVDADEQTIEEYFIREQGGRIGLLELSDQLESAKARTREEAIERGILVQADENARRIVRGFLELAGFDEVIFARPQSEEEPEVRG